MSRGMARKRGYGSNIADLEMMHHPVPCAGSQQGSVPVRCSGLFIVTLPTFFWAQHLSLWDCLPPLWQPFGASLTHC